ncbi:very-long-chain (3R)-3-hydroxyacyl-CoA dehydratase PASTICCINO 2A-like [Miscanthus floridulus]|uniref:very-long-chain (3R)-3-hydroxyacyl-CoA dehydratase PASTICCINO 2A-like n=1 Tax=Miscanthus floridulus TaxID=154761 RepID=UPI00345AAE6C
MFGVIQYFIQAIQLKAKDGCIIETHISTELIYIVWGNPVPHTGYTAESQESNLQIENSGVKSAVAMDQTATTVLFTGLPRWRASARRLYLSVYNRVVFFGWAQVLYYAVLTLRESGHKAVYAAVERPLQFAQTAAIMEILHGLVGLVRSPVSATLPQIGSRLFLTWGVLWSFPETQSHLLVTTLVISWSITEIIRYSFFGMKEAFGFAPSWLLWLRYSTFMLLYPTGISSEVGLIYIALPYMKASEKYCLRMPNKCNFSYDYFYSSILALLIYVPGSPHMYRYMLSQRKKALSKAKVA